MRAWKYEFKMNNHLWCAFPLSRSKKMVTCREAWVEAPSKQWPGGSSAPDRLSLHSYSIPKIEILEGLHTTLDSFRTKLQISSPGMKLWAVEAPPASISVTLREGFNAPARQTSNTLKMRLKSRTHFPPSSSCSRHSDLGAFEAAGVHHRHGWNWK